jgi:hypothetical protein
MTALVTSVFALPLVAAAAYLAVQFRDEAMSPERAPIKSTQLCVGNNIAESPELTTEPGPGPGMGPGTGPQPRYRASLGHFCGDVKSAFTEPKRTTSIALRGLDCPDYYLYANASVTTNWLIPDLSIWPFTDPDTIGYVPAGDHAPVPSPAMPRNLKEINPVAHEALADVQRSLNQRILLLAGGVIVLIALVATGTRLALRRAFRPVAVAAPPVGMGSIIDRLSEVSSDLVLLMRLDPKSPDSFDLAVLAHQESARRYPPDLTYVVDLGDDPVPVRGNPELINLLLTDLLDNAERQATSTVTLRLRTTPQFAVLEAILDDSTSGSHHYSTEVLPLR